MFSQGKQQCSNIPTITSEWCYYKSSPLFYLLVEADSYNFVSPAHSPRHLLHPLVLLWNWLPLPMNLITSSCPVLRWCLLSLPLFVGLKVEHQPKPGQPEAFPMSLEIEKEWGVYTFSFFLGAAGNSLFLFWHLGSRGRSQEINRSNWHPKRHGWKVRESPDGPGVSASPSVPGPICISLCGFYVRCP